MSRPGRQAPWSGQVGWHVADWGTLGWAETALKAGALAAAVVMLTVRLSGIGADDGWAVPAGHRLPFWLLVTVAAGYLLTVVDRLVDREVISLLFVAATLVGYWSLVWAMGYPPWPATLVRGFAVLMLAGELVKIAYFITTGARVRSHPPMVPVVMTSAVAAVHVLVVATA